MNCAKQELVNTEMIHNYLHGLTGRFFKILPIRETNGDTLRAYAESLQLELIGFKSLMTMIQNDQRMLSLISTLQYLIDTPDCELHIVRREVFRSIGLCQALDSEYGLVTQTEGGASNEPLGDL